MAKRLKIHAGIRNATTYVTASGNILTTADVGKMHDLGADPRLPKRSWLTEPVEDFVKANPIVGDLEEYAERLKEYILEGFETNGHGKWIASQTLTDYKKKSGDTVSSGDPISLVDTGQLRDDIEVWLEWVED